MADNTSENIGIGLNLTGNALGSVQQLAEKMSSLRTVAGDLGSALKTVNAELSKLDTAARKQAKKDGLSIPAKQQQITPRTLKRTRQELDLLMTTPDNIRRSISSRENKNALDAQYAALERSRRNFANANTMRSTLNDFDPKVVKSVLETRLNVARVQGDIKKAEEAKRGLDQYQKAMAELSIKLKSVAALRTLQDQAAAEFLKQPMSEMSVKYSAKNRLNRNYLTAADEKAIGNYMANPKTLKPSADPLTGGSTRQSLTENAQKTAAATRLMSQKYLEPDSASRTKELASLSKILDSLESEKTKLQAISNLKRNSVKQTDDELQALRRINDQQKLNTKVQQVVNGSLNVKSMTADQIGKMSESDLYARQASMVKRLSQAKTAMFDAERTGNAKTISDSKELFERYRQEVAILNAKTKAITDANKEQRSESEISGMRLANRMSFLRDFAMLGAVIGAISGSYKFLRDFEVALKQTQAIAQATDTQMKSLSSSILDVSENSRFSAVEITEAATALAQAGFSMSEIETTLKSVTLLATATGSTLKETVDIATSSLGAFQLSAENMPRIVNQITQAMNLSKLDIQKFQLAVQYAGNSASDAGLDFEELLASVATVANAGVRSGSTLGTGFRQLLTDLVAPSQKFSEILTRLGLSVGDVDIRTKGLVGALKTLREAGFTTADAYQSFEVRSVAFYTALSNNLQTYDSLSANLDNNTAAMDANEIQMNSLAAQTDRAGNQFKALAEVAGAGVRDSLTTVMRLIADMLTGLKDLMDNGFVRATAQIIVMGTALTAGTLILRSAIGAVAALMNIWKGATVVTAGATASTLSLAGAMAVLRTALTSTVPLIAIISTLVSVAYVAFNRFKKSTDDLKQSMEEAKTTVNNLGDAISNTQTEIQEIDKKIVSLESRFESFKNDPVAVATEMVKLRERAAELGIALGTDLTSNIESVRKGWEELRISLGKELVMNLDNQVSQLQNLAMVTAQLRGREAAEQGNLTSSINAENLKYDEVYDLKTGERLTTSPNNVSYSSVMSGGTQNIANRNDNRGAQIYEAIAQGNRADGGKGYAPNIKAIVDELATFAQTMTNLPEEEFRKQVVEIRKKYALITTITRASLSQYQQKSFKSKGKEKEAANATVTSLTNFLQALDKNTNQIIEGYASTLSQKDMTQNQSSTQDAKNKLDKKLMGMRDKGLASNSNLGNLTKIAAANKPASLSYAQEKRLNEVRPFFEAASQETGVPVDILIAQSIQESALGSSRVRGKGVDENGKEYSTKAVGLMQVTPAAATRIGVTHASIDGNDKNNIMAGAKYLALMYKQTGNWEEALRMYFMGEGAYPKYKSGQRSKRLNHLYKESTNYVNKIAPTAFSVGKTDGRSIVTGELEVPENIQVALSLIEQVKAMQETEVANFKKMFGENVDPSKIPADKKEAYQKSTAQIQALQASLSDLQAQTNNGLQAAQAKDMEERKRARADKQYDLEVVKAEISKIEQNLRVVQELMDENGADYEDSINTSKKLFDQLGGLKEKEAQMTAELTKFDATTYIGSNTVLNNSVSRSADLKLETDIKTSKIDIATRLKARLKSAAEAYGKLIKEQNDKFIEDVKAEISKQTSKMTGALQATDVQKQLETWSIEDQGGLSEKRAQRAQMDDPRYEGQYSSLQKETLDRDISRTSLDALKQSEVNKLTADLTMYKEHMVDLKGYIEKTQVEQAALTEKLQANALKIQDPTIRDAVLKDIKDKQQKFTQELSSQNAEMFKLQGTIRDTEQQLKNSDVQYKPTQMGVGDTIKQIIEDGDRQMQSQEQRTSEINNVLGAVQGSFNTLISTAWEASDSFDDFFKMLTGGSKESADAFKAFGRSIVESMLKVLQDRISQQFMNLLGSMLSGGSDSGVSNAINQPSATLYGQRGYSVDGGGMNGVWGTILKVGAQMVSSYLGGGAVNTNLGSSSSTGGADYSNAMYASGGFESSNGISYDLPIRRSQGGIVDGYGAPNVDTIPALLAREEYVMPKKVTDAVGVGFLDRLRADPKGVAREKFNLNVGQPAPQKPPSNTNVYVVSPNNVPSSLSKNDIVVAVADNLARNGQLKNLIKQVANE